MSVYSDLIRNSSAALTVAIELYPSDENGVIRPQYFATRSLWTEADESPPNQWFKSSILPGWKLSRRLTSTGSDGQSYLAGGSEADLSVITVRDEEGSLADVIKYNWKDAQIIARIGGVVDASGNRYRYSDFVPFFTGALNSATINGDGNVEFSSSGTLARFDDSIQDFSYYSLGSGIRFDPGYATSVSAGDLESISDASIIALLKMREPPPGSSIGRIAWKGFTGNESWQLIADYATRSVRFKDNGLEIASPVDPDLWEKREMAVAVTVSSDVMILYTGAPGSIVESARASIVNGSLNSNSRPLVFAAREYSPGLFDSFGYFDLLSFAIFDTALTPLQVSGYSNGLIESPATTDNLVRYWPINEVDGTVAYPTAGSYDISLLSGAEFVSSLTGDDPSIGSSIEGTPKPLLWGGPARNMGTVMVDSRRAIYQVSGLPMTEITRVYADMSELYPDEQQIVSATGGIQMVAASDTVVLSGDLTARRYIPAQVDPEVTGQRIEIVGAVASGGANNGTYRISTISADYKTIGLISEDGLGTADLVNETLPIGAYIGTLGVDAHYAFDLDTATVTLPSSGFGQITVDGSALPLIDSIPSPLPVSLAIKLLLGFTINTDQMIFDPDVVIRIGSEDGNVSVRSIIEKLALSAFAWIKTNRNGGIELITIRPPSGEPKITITWSSPSILDTEKIAPVIAKVHRFNTRRMSPPPRLLQVGYDRTWTIPNSLPGFVSLSRIELLSNSYRWAEIGNPKDASSLSTSERSIETMLIDRQSAQEWLSLASDFYFRDWRIAQVSVVGYPSAIVDIGDNGIIEHPHPNHGITTGNQCVLNAIDENPATGSADLELLYETDQ